MRLFTEGDLPAELLEEQRTALSRERYDLEEQRQRLEARQGATIDLSGVEERMESVLAAIREWVEGADTVRNAISVESSGCGDIRRRAA